MPREIYKEFNDANVLGVKVKHNGFQGGDIGHGSYVKIKFTDITSTVMNLNGIPVNEFEFSFMGDTERKTLLKGLKMIVDELENHQYLPDEPETIRVKPRIVKIPKGASLNKPPLKPQE